MWVAVTRRGGIAGVALHAELDTAQLAAADASRVEAALRDLPWGRPAAEPIGADRFRYEMVTVESDHERRVELGEGEITDALRPLLDLLRDHGHIGPPSSR